MDFNLKIYLELLKALQSQGFLFQTVSAYAEARAKVVDKVKVEGDPTQPWQLSDYSGKNGATHSGAFGASIPVHSAPPPKWRKLGLETGE